jgi:mitochondrial import receptor subunit TOM40
MGNVHAAESAAAAASAAPEVDRNPGTMEDLHKKCKDVFPMYFEGCKFLVNKGLSNNFQVSHTLTMSNTVPSGYRQDAVFIIINNYLFYICCRYRLLSCRL